MLSLVCAATIWINLTNSSWNDHDKKIYKRAKFVCENQYKNTPCVKKFIKSGKKMYRVICGYKKG